MLHAYQLDMVDRVTRAICGGSEPFGGIQVILCGDFFQLPPVTKNGAEQLFAFQSEVWESGKFSVCYLEEQHRQKNDPLLTILNEIRSGIAGEQTKVPLRSRYKKMPLDSDGKALKPTILYARNINVDSINEQELAKLHGHDSNERF